MYFLYRFLDKDNNIIYVGKTTKSMKKRMNGHKHCPKQCYKERKEIQYAELETEADLFIYEVYYINKYMPKYNKATKYQQSPQGQIVGLVWKDYKTNQIVEDDSKNLQAINPMIFNLRSQIQSRDETIGILKDNMDFTERMLKWEKESREKDFVFYHQSSEQWKTLCQDWQSTAYQTLNERNRIIKKYNTLYKKYKKMKLILNMTCIIIFCIFIGNIIF
ncbi:MAG: GIY-YIG nuclease family protein [Clostridia bacterium]